MINRVRSFWKDIETNRPPLHFSQSTGRPLPSGQREVPKSKRARQPTASRNAVAAEFAFFSKSSNTQGPEAWSKLPAHLWTQEALARWEQILPSQAEKKNQPLTHLEWSTGHSLRAQWLPTLEALSPFELHTQLRETWAAIWQSTLSAQKKSPLRLELNLDALSELEQKRILPALVFLANTCTWKPYTFVKTQSESKRKPLRKAASQAALQVTVHCTLSSKEFKELVTQATQLAECNNWVRTLTDLPANFLNPGNYRDLATTLARSEGWKTEFLSTQKLRTLGANAFLAVTRADPHSESGILKIVYRPKNAKKKLALVGKGLCFDTGGYNIKTGSGMNGMHGDMSGSAVALACLAYFAKTKAPIEVTAYLALAENLISPTAFKPNEVVTACDDTTIEVVDTDAEGRMVLADTLALARRGKPDLCLDFATLTGAAIRALDTRMGAVFTNQSELATHALRAGQASGERVWPFPLEPDYKKQLKSDVAELLQCTHGSNSDHIYAATFLAHFIGEETPWIHLDLSPAKNRGGLGLITTTTTGFGVQWAVQTVNAVLKLDR